MNKDNFNKLITEALAIEARDAKEAGALGFMARALVQATMPHKNPGQVEAWGRRNGDFSMIMQPGYMMDKNNNTQSIGLPYGTKPRLVMAFISSEAVKSRSREIVLGRSLSEFMRQLDLTPTGGRWGTIPMLKEQMKRLFSTTISFRHDGKEAETSGGFRIASKSILFWDTKNPNQAALWESTVTLSQEFYDEIIERPIPLDMRALAALKGSSLALDIYCWLTYRMSYLNKSTVIPWEALQMQFGSNYANDAHGTRNFKMKFLEQLKKVYAVYDGLKVIGEQDGLVLHPGKTHVRKKIIVERV
jgi:hypothetical protein